MPMTITPEQLAQIGALIKGGRFVLPNQTQAPADPNAPVVPDLFSGNFNGPAATIDASNSSFQPVDPNEVERLAVQFDTKGYNLSDADYAKRFPKLVQGRDFNIDNAGANLRGEQDPLVSSALKTSGLGDINFGDNPYAQSKNMGMGILDKTKRDRGYFSRTLAYNPQRIFGLSGQDIAHIALANTNGQNVFNQGAYGARVNAAITGQQQDAQNSAALISGLGSVIGAAGKGYASSYLTNTGYGNSGNGRSDIRLKENIIYLGTSAMGIAMILFNYIGDDRLYLGSVAQQVREIVPQAVFEDDGYLSVNYNLIDVPFMELNMEDAKVA